MTNTTLREAAPTASLPGAVCVLSVQMTNDQCSMPNAQCPMPHAPCPMTNDK
ncbi:MAG: hypothetical protein RMY64_19150 [Nostoc sp. DedQUE08]|uniref:hypothetical protein n=1 Tax=unclassified Nostoc TaxID=2593658 RepID=UPI002AD2675A|nr:MULTISPECIES: hypothetical protein [unclassified Nostoc]MDZ8067708.1 hypothetical protein [Nostoc sp. DedQUE08]MDZ8132755.1 hypothetical protein [Nostoc sp. DedQUE07]